MKFDLRAKSSTRYLWVLVILFCLAFSVSTLAAEVPAPANLSAQSATHEVVKGSASSIDKYGNVSTDLPAAALFSAGYKLGDVLSVTIGSATFKAPLVSTYSDVDRGAYLVLPSKDIIALSISYGNFAIKNGVTVGMPVSLSLAEKAGYLNQYQIRHLEKSEKRTDYASDAIFANFRNVKLGAIASGRLYRSCHPANGEARAPYALTLTEKAGVKTVINLTDNPTELSKNIATVPYYQKLYNSGNLISLNMGVDFKSPDFIAKLKNGLLFMTTHQGPYLIHCNEGKDRAGMVCALLEGLMGAKVKEVTDDYMVSYVNYFHITKEDAKYNIISQIIINVLKDINYGEPVTDANLQAATERYLVKTVGLSPAEVKTLKSKLK